MESIVSKYESGNGHAKFLNLEATSVSTYFSRKSLVLGILQQCTVRASDVQRATNPLRRFSSMLVEVLLKTSERLSNLFWPS
jgi:hypothetical protein